MNDEIIENINNDVELEQDHNCNGEQEPVVDRAISRRDMATEMFPDSQSSSPRSSAVSSTKSSLSMTSPCPFDQSNRDNINSSEYEIRDVQVDKHASATRSITENHSITSSTTSFEPDNKISKYVSSFSSFIFTTSFVFMCFYQIEFMNFSVKL